jgi:hypothetical protein
MVLSIAYKVLAVELEDDEAQRVAERRNKIMSRPQ